MDMMSPFSSTLISKTSLPDSLFDNCDLDRTIFEATILEKADFRTAYHYSIDPTVNRIKKARFSRIGLEGLLDKYNLEIE